MSEVKRLLIDHLHDHYSLYDEFIGVRSARKHIGWYLRELPGGEAFRAHMNTLEEQRHAGGCCGAIFRRLESNNGPHTRTGRGRGES